MTAIEMIAVIAPSFDVGEFEPDIKPLALYRPIQEGPNPLVDLAAQPRDLAVGDALHAHRPEQLVD